MEDGLFPLTPVLFCEMNDQIQELRSLQFGLLSAEDILKQSVCEVNVPRLYGNHSVYDERMGVMDNAKRCLTCGLSNRDCIGHFGHIRLAVPILHPLFHKLALSLLKCICYQCSRVLMTKDQLELNGLFRYKHHTRFLKIMSKMDRVDYCSSCHEQQPRYVLSTSDRLVYMVFKHTEETVRTPLGEQDILNLFDGVPLADIELLGFDPDHFHPRNLVITLLPVIPPIARPYIMADNLMCDDDLTMQYTEIVKVNTHIAQMIQETPHDTTKPLKYIQSLKFRVKSLFDNSGDRQRLSNGRPLKGLKKRLTGKEGLIRNNLMGKRVDKSARTVIGPDPTLGIDEIAIPMEIADTLCVPVQVTAWNRASIEEMIDTGRAKFLLRDNGQIRINLRYASTQRGTRLCFGDIVVKRRHGRRLYEMVQYDQDLFMIEEGDVILRDGVRLPVVEAPQRRKVELRIGDIVERKLQDGDILLLNRQPTLHKGSMIAQKVVVRPFKTIRMNLAITKTFNADFDGDEMNLHCPASPETETELRLLSGVENHLINCQSSRPNIVVVQDALLGAYVMTLSSEHDLLDRDHFFQVAMAIPDLSIDRMMTTLVRYQAYKGSPHVLYHGRVLFSLLLPDDFSYRSQNKADPKEPEVVIERGLLVAGAINKSNLSSSAQSILSVLYHEYGSPTCIRFLNHVQFLTNRYLLVRGFSIGLADCMIHDETDEIERAISKAFVKAKRFEMYVSDARIQEAYVTMALSGARDMGMRIAQTAMRADNNFIKTVVSGAKGDYFNIAQITGLLGQQNLNGHRIPYTLSNERRSLPHYPLEASLYTDDMRYESRGFIKSSFIHGLSPREFYFHAMTGREGITDTAMKTATSGYIQRRMIKLAEDIKVHYDGTVRNDMNQIIQFCYGENHLDPIQTQFRHHQAMPCNVSRLIDRLNVRFSPPLTESVS